MDHLRSIWRRLKTLALAALCWVALQGTVLAQAAEEENGDGGGAASWTLPYMLVVLAVGLGMLPVCYHSRRRERARPESYEERKMVKELRGQ